MPSAKPDIEFKKAATPTQFQQILDLQHKNHRVNVDEKQQGEQGFVFASHNLEKLEIMSNLIPQVVAMNGDTIAGYNLSMTAEMKDLLPELSGMFRQFGQLQYRQKRLSAYNYIVGGQVCVAKEYRGLGLLRKLYLASRDFAGPDYHVCVTEISVRNKVSLKAHEKMGFEIIGTYKDEFEEWNIVAWNMWQAI